MVKMSRIMLKHSKDLRINQTDWEIILWKHLRANNLGVKFKRQVVVGQYIFDFGSKQKKLLIEVDGYGHKNEHRDADKRKIDTANSLGYKVLKFWNSDIENRLSLVLEKIQQALDY